MTRVTGGRHVTRVTGVSQVMHQSCSAGHVRLTPGPGQKLIQAPESARGVRATTLKCDGLKAKRRERPSAEDLNFSWNHGKLIQLDETGG